MSDSFTAEDLAVGFDAFVRDYIAARGASLSALRGVEIVVAPALRKNRHVLTD